MALFGIELHETSPLSFARLVERLMLHMGFGSVTNVDGPGDSGADIVGKINGQTWVVQSKWKKTGKVGSEAVEELIQGMLKYNATYGAVATNTGVTPAALESIKRAGTHLNYQIKVWDSARLSAAFDSEACANRFGVNVPRQYQIDAVQAIWHDLTQNHRALLFMATGLGKTYVAAQILERFIATDESIRVLVLAHQVQLVDQLERALWPGMSKKMPTQLISSTYKPDYLPGITVSTIQTAVNYVRNGYKPDFLLIDEAHHAGSDGQYAEIFNLLPDVPRLGLTATPWRSDQFDIANHFGLASFKIGIAEGMRLGWLASVDYKLFVDNLDWDFVQTASQNSYSIKDLNRRLFLPQRDEEIRDRLIETWFDTRSPKGIVFCQTIEHANKFAEILKNTTLWRNAETLTNDLSVSERKSRIAKFRLGHIPLLVAVDMLNEGIDVPDVNIICFLRTTHSRRIFVQQLGRGLRTTSDPEKSVKVLDFVSDLRRVAALMDIRGQLGPTENLALPHSQSISFNSQEAESLFDEWIKDAASLETENEEYRLNFLDPESPAA
jgi:superfamily II DNA or RNA helicase